MCQCWATSKWDLSYRHRRFCCNCGFTKKPYFFLPEIRKIVLSESIPMKPLFPNKKLPVNVIAKCKYHQFSRIWKLKMRCLLAFLCTLALWMPRCFGINNQGRIYTLRSNICSDQVFIMRTTNGVYIRPNRRYFATKQNTSQQPAVFNRRISYVDIVSLKKEKRCCSW